MADAAAFQVRSIDPDFSYLALIVDRRHDQGPKIPGAASVRVVVEILAESEVVFEIVDEDTPAPVTPREEYSHLGIPLQASNSPI